jgi:hypothetical protein
MKNVETVLLGLVDALLTDCTSTFPGLFSEFITCRRKIHSAFKCRGLPYFTITLPECAKFLEHSLEEGCIPDDRPPYHRRFGEFDRRPVFLHGLWSLCFDEEGCVLDNADQLSIAALRNMYMFAKKLKLDCDQSYVDDTVNQYIEIESSLPRPRPDTWYSDVPTWSRPTGHPLWGNLWDDPDARQHLLSGFEQPKTSFNQREWALFRVLCSKLSASFGEVDVWAIRPKHGPGAVSDSSQRLIKYEFTNWPRKLEAVFPADFFASTDYVNRVQDESEKPCKLIAVPKTQKGPRLIASEPTAHQWIQGGLQRWLEERIALSPLGLSIDFRSQAMSQALALEASQSGDYATVDLSSASDRLSARLVDYVFQANHSLLDALHACRSRSVVIPKGLHPKGIDEVLLLRKYAAQGSGTTFPVQTIIFTIIGHFALMLADGSQDCSLQSLRTRAHRLRVFGDDIIIDSKAYEYLTRLLSELGLKVNETKSFHKGKFREACGMDAYNGVDVTPAYIRQIYDPSIPETLASIIECSNNFYKRGWWATSDWVLKTVDSKIIENLAVTSEGTGAITLFSFSGKRYPPHRRYNRSLHREEYLSLVLTSRSVKTKGSGEASLLQYFTESPDQELWGSVEPLSDWSTGQAERPRLRIKSGWVEMRP